jgi:hypothetical protein
VFALVRRELAELAAQLVNHAARDVSASIGIGKHEQHDVAEEDRADIEDYNTAAATAAGPIVIDWNVKG